jgi:predicted DNA-binding antitoxin AbrB/MazE fold protein
MRVDAVYESGVLKPLEPLDLAENERVVISVMRASEQDRSHIDHEYLERVRKEVAESGPVPSLEEVRRILSKDTSSWSEAIIAEREERF